MRTMTYKIILGFILLLFIGCGGGSTNTTGTTEETTRNGPASPIITDKEKSPPSIPSI